jgi:hypothetical protein
MIMSEIDVGYFLPDESSLEEAIQAFNGAIQ